MLLGQLITRLTDETVAEQVLDGLDDRDLHTSIEFRRTAEGLSRSRYLKSAVSRFVEEADDDAWQTLNARIGRSEDPGGAALGEMLRWAIQKAPRASGGCGCGGSGGCGHG